jgi:hypothetical protein
MTFCFESLARMLRKQVQPNPVSVEITGPRPLTAIQMDYHQSAEGTFCGFRVAC